MSPATSLERYVAGESVVHQLDPRVKVLLTLLFIIGNLLIGDGRWATFVAAWLFLLGCVWLGQVSLALLLRRSLVALPFALAALSVLFNQPGEPLWVIALPGATLTISDGGVVRFASILVRSWLSVQMAILLTATTAFADLMHALRHLRTPAILVSIISFMYRYLFVLAEEASRMLRARAARSASGGKGSGGSLLWRGRVAGGMVGQLFVRSYERSERVYRAMLARGYQGQMLTMNPHVMRGQDWLALGLGAGLLALIQAGSAWLY